MHNHGASTRREGCRRGTLHHAPLLDTAPGDERRRPRSVYCSRDRCGRRVRRPWGEAVGSKDLATGQRGKRLWRLSVLAFAVATALLVVAKWSWIDAQARAVVVLSPVREVPEVRRLAEGLARAGYLVGVPDLPGLRWGEIRPQTVHETLEVAREVSERPDARGGAVGLVGVSTGATLALLAAEDGELAQKISVVAGVAPYTDVRTVLSTATTGYYRGEDGELVPYEVDPFLAGAITQSLVSTLPPSRDRDVLLDELEEVDRMRPEFLDELRGMGPDASSVAELLENRDPNRFDGLYGGLPEGVRAKMEELSPLAGDGTVSVPVELISGPHDKYFPLSETQAAVRIAPQARVTVSEALDHVELSPSVRDLPALLLIDGFVVRSLRQARL